jgi:hypothetical protein
MFKFHPFLGSAVAVVCVACGASFSANEGGAAAGSGGSAAAGGGSPSSAGSSSAGDAGEMAVGGTGAAGEGSTAGAGGTVTGVAGASAGRGGSGHGGGTGGGGAGTDCATLEQEYRATVEKARVCEKGSTDQCSPSSAAEAVGGCGCPVLINAKSEYAAAAKKAYQAYQNNKCGSSGPVCNIFCAPAATASCAQQTMGTGSAFVCSAGAVIQN